jgi:hypothetical protein
LLPPLAPGNDIISVRTSSKQAARVRVVSKLGPARLPDIVGAGVLRCRAKLMVRYEDVEPEVHRFDIGLVAVDADALAQQIKPIDSPSRRAGRWQALELVAALAMPMMLLIPVDSGTSLLMTAGCLRSA